MAAKTAAVWLGAAMVLASSSGASGAALDASTAAPPPSTTVTLEQLNQCGEKTKYGDDAGLLSNEYDGERILRQFGGPPGDMASADVVSPLDLPVVWSAVSMPVRHFVEFYQRDAAAEYNYSASDNRTFVRVERSSLPPSAEPGNATAVDLQHDEDEDDDEEDYEDEDVDIDLVGELWWTPPDLCGYLRTAEYRVQGGNLTFSVLRRHCAWRRDQREILCFGPDAGLVGLAE